MHAAIADDWVKRRAVTSASPNVFTRILSFSSQKRNDIINTHTKNDKLENTTISTSTYNHSSSNISVMSSDSNTTPIQLDTENIYDVSTDTIDSLMYGLYAYCSVDDDYNDMNNSNNKDSPLRQKIDNIKHNDNLEYSHDWLLDGSDDSAEEGNNQELYDELVAPLSPRTQRRRRKFGDKQLDQMLGLLEIENQSYTSTPGASSCDTSVIDDDVNNPGDNEEEVIEFVADFSQFDSSVTFEQQNGEENGVGKSTDTLEKNSNLQHDVLYEYDDQNEKCNDEDEEVKSQQQSVEEVPDAIEVPPPQEAEVDTEHAESQEGGGEEVYPYEPPKSIACLVSDLDAELDVTIDECLDSPPNKLSTTQSGESSSSHENDYAHPPLHEESDNMILQPILNQQHKQSLLMSSTLLESLPIPMPSSIEDHLASLTRRIQMNHMASKDKEGYIDLNQSVQVENDELEGKLMDTIHSGYYESNTYTGDDGAAVDNDYFDSIVMEEVLAVPWPFHEIDLKESILNEDDSDQDSDGLLLNKVEGSDEEQDPDESQESRSIDHLNFDTYVSNRLSQLDSASDEIMSCMLHRVSQKEEAINKGVENVFAAELDVSTALLFAKSSREYLHNAKNGYPLRNTETGQMEKHNVISASLDILHMADSKDRLRYLLETIDQVSSICDEEAQWWKEVNAKMIPSERFEKLVNDTRRLKEMVKSEEVLTQATSLSTMKDRLSGLPEALLWRIEESLAELFSRILNNSNKKTSFETHLLEFETLLQAWLSCIQLKVNSAQKSRASIIGAEWSSCILTILSFEASKAVASAVIDTYHDVRMNNQVNNGFSTLEEDQMKLDEIKFGYDHSGLDSLCNRLLIMRLGGGHHSSALSSTLFHLSSRLVELMSLYETTLQWLETLVHKMDVENKPIATTEDVVTEQFKCGRDNSGVLNHTIVSSVSSAKQSASSSSSNDDAPPQDQDEQTVPQDLQFEMDKSSSDDIHKAVQKSTGRIRHSIWKKCELALIHLIEFYMSQSGGVGVQTSDGKDFATGNLQQTYNVLLQFKSYSSHFLNDDEDDGEDDSCFGLENELSKLYTRHLRSIHIEAMKTTGTLLRHESWHLAPLQLARSAFKPKDNGNSSTRIMQSIYEAVGDLVSASTHDENKSEEHYHITTRAKDHGYRYCTSFAQFLDDLPTLEHTLDAQISRHLNCFGISSDTLASMILPLVETSNCGEQTISILTQSSANGLVKWTTKLLAIGNALPLVADDACTAVISLFDLYILTVFRLCASSKANEDVLIGLGRGAASSSSMSSTSVSLTMEADAVAPLPRERKDFVQTQEFIKSSRERLESMVNLDKFQSTDDDMMDCGPMSPQSKHPVTKLAKRLEKEAAAACSCYFAAILVDVLSDMFNKRLSPASELWDDPKDNVATLIENNGDDNHSESLDTYARSVVTVMPKLVTQATRFATVNALSGKALMFQIICYSRVWENSGSMQEEPNDYVEQLCDLSALLWGHMSSSMKLPTLLLEYTWNEVVRSAFLLLLEGYSKIANCSTEGRSLMSMDLATLSHGLTPQAIKDEIEEDHPNISPPPKACREEMMRYVDTYIKVFYFPNDEILNWVKDNAVDYHKDYCTSLVTAKAAGAKDKKFMTQGNKSVTDIYSKLPT